MNQNDKNKFEKFGMTHNQLQELRSFLVERMVDNMSDAEFVDEAKNYWEDHYDEVVKDIQDYTDCDFKRDRRESFYDSLSEGKDS